MNAIEDLLNDANRIMQKDGVYWRVGRRPQTVGPDAVGGDDDGGHYGDVQTEGNPQPGPPDPEPGLANIGSQPSAVAPASATAEPGAENRQPGLPDGGIPVQVTRESGDLNAYLFGDAPQTFRMVLWSIDRDALGANPARGDVLRVGGETFKVVERDGVTWRRRFDGWDSRIMFYTEQQG